MTSRLVLPFADVGSGIVPNDGAKLTFKKPGLETLKNTFSDAAGTIANTNPVVSDATGLFSNIYINGNYDVVLQDKNNVQIWADSVSEFATTADAATVKNFSTLALAVADTGLVVDDALNLKENVSGSGGAGTWDVVLSSTVTENAFNIVQCVGVPTLSLVLRIEDATLNLLQIGATLTGDIFATWVHAISLDEVAIIKLPRSSALTLSGEILINKALRIDGAGSCSAQEAASGGAPGTSTTRISCTGTNINGIVLQGTATEGVENIHLSNFSLFGTSSMNDGIQLGQGVLVTKSSMINVHVRGFTKTGKLGVRFTRCLEFYMENVYTQTNAIGMGNLNGDICTTMRMMNCHSRTNAGNGTLIQGTFSGGTVVGLINEGNSAEGLVIAPGVSDSCIGNDFYGIYSEANASGLAPIVIGNGAGIAKSINFHGGNIVDDVTGVFSGKSIHLDKAEKVIFNKIELTTFNAGFMSATTSTSSCQFETAVSSIVETDVTGNSVVSGNPRVKVIDGNSKIKVGTISRDISAVDGAVVESGLGFLPRVIQFTAAVDNTSMMSMGMTDGTAQLSVHDSNAVTTDTYGIVTGTIVLRSGASVIATGTVTITDIGEFTITWAKTGSPTGTATIFYTVHG